MANNVDTGDDTGRGADFVGDNQRTGCTNSAKVYNDRFCKLAEGDARQGAVQEKLIWLMLWVLFRLLITGPLTWPIQREDDDRVRNQSRDDAASEEPQGGEIER
jgi:hypothetical protein